MSRGRVSTSMVLLVVLLSVAGSWSTRSAYGQSETTETTELTVAEQRIVSIPDARIVSLSPDGKWVAAVRPIFAYQRGELCVFDVETSAERSCADISGLDAGIRLEDVSWSPDGSHLAFTERAFILFRDGDLWLMDAATGELTNLDDDSYSGNLIRLSSDEPPPDYASIPVNPTFSPDGQTVSFSRTNVVNGDFAGNDIATVSIDGGEPEVLTRVTLDLPGVVYFGIRWAPGASQLFYGFHSPDRGDERNGIWVVNRDGLGQQLIAPQIENDEGAAAVLQVSADGRTLLLYHPLAAILPGEPGDPHFALLDLDSGVVTPIHPPDPSAPPEAFVSLAALSPDGTKLLTVSRLTNPENAIWVQTIGGTDAIRLGEPPENAGWTEFGLIPTWAVNGSVLIPGGPDFSNATYLMIAGSTYEPAPIEERTPVVDGTPFVSNSFAVGDTVIVASGGAEVRSAPSPDASVVLDVDARTDLTILSNAEVIDGVVWWPVLEPESKTIGWIAEEFIRVID